MHPHDTTNEVPYGYCQCGCGQKTTISKQSQKSQGIVKGVPYRFRQGHNRRRIIKPEQRCSRCGESKPATIAYFARDKRATGGIQNVCKACNRRYHQGNKERIAAFGARYRAENKGKIAERDRLYRAKNKEKVAENHRRYRANNKKKLAEYIGRYRSENREIFRAAGRRRHSLKLNIKGTHTAADIKRQYKAQKGCCYYCGAKVGKKYHVDHIVPLSRGGSNDPSNLVIACPPCNMAKHDKLPHEWPQGNRLL